MKYLVANWKCHKSEDEALAWCEGFAASYQESSGIEVVLAAPTLYLISLANFIRRNSLSLKLASQDISPYPMGSYTGALAADMLGPYVDFALVGHSERRRYFAESIAQVAQKTCESQSRSICPIICCGEDNIEQQLAAIDSCENSLLAYTPEHAHNSGQVQRASEICSAVKRMRRFFPGASVIYGGAIFPENVGELWAMPELSGIFVGRSSLDITQFLEIVQLCQKNS